MIERTNSSITVEWDPVTDSAPDHSFEYTVCAEPLPKPKVASEFCKNTGNTNYTFINLVADTKYNITVRACATQDPKLCSLYSGAIQNRTKPIG